LKDARLSDINFREIVDYRGQPRVENAYSTPPVCQGYCISCEESGLLKNTGGTMTPRWQVCRWLWNKANVKGQYN
jgi:hypothetical protein